LRLAKEIDRALDTEMQLWLVDYWQSLLWDRYRKPEPIRLLDRARRSLLAYVQPRLVWERTLLDMIEMQIG
jgi:DNA polymerase-3 subunit delta'